MSQERKIGLHVEEARIRTSYANAFQARYAEGEILLTCGVSRMEPASDTALAGTVVVEMQDRLAMTPQSAKRLVSTLAHAIQEYEERFGSTEPEGKTGA